MFRQFLRGKIHRATITQCDPDYVGSITIDADLLRAADIRPNELVHVVCVDNAARFETYVIRGEPGSGIIGVNGAAAKLVKPGYKVIIMCYGMLTNEQIEDHHARVILADDHNRASQVLLYSSNIDEPAFFSQK